MNAPQAEGASARHAPFEGMGTSHAVGIGRIAGRNRPGCRESLQVVEARADAAAATTDNSDRRQGGVTAEKLWFVYEEPLKLTSIVYGDCRHARPNVFGRMPPEIQVSLSSHDRRPDDDQSTGNVRPAPPALA